MIPGRLEIAREVRAIHAALGAFKPPPLESTWLCGARVASNPAANSEFPSSNPNQVEWLDSDGELTGPVIDAFIGHFRGRGIGRFFLWTVPDGPDGRAGLVLRERGFVEWTDAGYPTLARDCTPVPGARTELIVRTADRQEAERHGAVIKEIQGAAGDAFLRTLGLPGFTHFVACDGERPVAAAILFVNGRVGYLGSAATHPEHRGRGAQGALIAARVARAGALGCGWCASETLDFLTTSLANLRRAGFETVFNARVFRWGG